MRRPNRSLPRSPALRVTLLLLALITLTACEKNVQEVRHNRPNRYNNAGYDTIGGNPSGYSSSPNTGARGAPTGFSGQIQSGARVAPAAPIGQARASIGGNAVAPSGQARSGAGGAAVNPSGQRNASNIDASVTVPRGTPASFDGTPRSPMDGR